MSKQSPLNSDQVEPIKKTTIQPSLPLEGKTEQGKALAAPANNNEGWIDVEEQLPEPGESVLVVQGTMLSV